MIPRRRKSRNRAPLPKKMPGQGCRLSLKDRSYVLYLDDVDGTSYNLGPQVGGVRNVLMAWGFDRQDADNVIDLATEYKSAFLRDDGVSVPDIPRRRPQRAIKFDDEPDEEDEDGNANSKHLTWW